MFLFSGICRTATLCQTDFDVLSEVSDRSVVLPESGLGPFLIRHQRIGDQQGARIGFLLIGKNNRDWLGLFDFDDCVIGVGNSERVLSPGDLDRDLLVASFDNRIIG